MKALVIAALLIVGVAGEAAAQPRPASVPKPEGEMRWARYATLARAWFDPGEITGGFLTPFWVLCARTATTARHDGAPTAPAVRPPASPRATRFAGAFEAR